MPATLASLAERLLPGPLAVPARHAGSSVVAPLLNHRDDLAQLGGAALSAPYKAAPRAPVLYLRPRNTWCTDGDEVVVPQGVTALQVGVSLAAVIGRNACRVKAQDAMQFVAGWLLVNDLCIPHTSFYRPALPQRCRDGFCVMSGAVAAGAAGAAGAMAQIERLPWQVFIDGKEAAAGDTGDASTLVRPFAQLLADVTDFMTLQAGDVLLLGTRALGPLVPLVRAGQTVRVGMSGIGQLSNRFIAQEPQL
jgi:5-oxopent-3-ene-1,2,5-tricarboxylate decarboxylase / 2-hydroxyhepta-2,4-diene-1,7-dioate isomerase